jgi:hypothetical protein
MKFNHTAGIVASSYPRSIGQDEDSRRQPDGEQWFHNGLNFSDVTVRHPLSPSHLTYAHRVGKILDSAVTSKLTRYLAYATERGASFSVLAITSYGGLSEEFFKFLQKVANHAEANSFSSITDRTRFLNKMVQSIVSTLMKANAWMYHKGIRDSRRKYGYVAKAANQEAVNLIIATQKDAKRNELLHAN